MNDRTKYHRTITGVDGRECIVDIYAVLEAFGVIGPAEQHAVKKLLFAGRRGKGSVLDDLGGAALAIERAIQMEQARGVAEDSSVAPTAEDSSVVREPYPGEVDKMYMAQHIDVLKKQLDCTNFALKQFQGLNERLESDNKKLAMKLEVANDTIRQYGWLQDENNRLRDKVAVVESAQCDIGSWRDRNR